MEALFTSGYIFLAKVYEEVQARASRAPGRWIPEIHGNGAPRPANLLPALLLSPAMKSKTDLILGPAGEGGLVLAIAAIGWAIGFPLIFSSLGPTIYEMIEQPHMKSARIYNVIVGHMIALGAGFFGLWLIGAWNAPKVASAGIVPPPRIWAAVIAVAVTTILTPLLKASQPAALSTALLVSLGVMQTAHDAAAIVIGILVVSAIGQPIRMYRLRSRAALSD